MWISGLPEFTHLTTSLLSNLLELAILRRLSWMNREICGRGPRHVKLSSQRELLLCRWSVECGATVSFSGQPVDIHYLILCMEDEGDDEVRAWFPCPFCYLEIEVPSLCVRLQEEHCFDLKNAVCPICAANLGKDAIGHCTLQQAHSIKRRKNSKKSDFWSNVSTKIAKDLRELSSVLGANSLTCPNSGSEPAPDLFLSPFFCTVPLAVPKDGQKDISPCVAASDTESNKPFPSDDVEWQDYEERGQRATFLQGLLVSTIFLDF